MFILVFILTLLILVIIHELGHFLACKKFNIKVLEFGFGIPPRLWGKKFGETLWSINLLPIGGFVRPLGEDDDGKNLSSEDKKDWQKRSFQTQTVGKRMMVVVAGVLMNLALAFLLFYIVLFSQDFRVQLPLLSDHQFFGVTQINEKVVLVGSVADNSPAQIAGIKSGDRVIALNNELIKDSAGLIDQTRANAGKKIRLTLSDTQKTKFKTVEVTPRVNPPAGQGALGISLGTFEIANLNYQTALEKLLAGPIHSLNLIAYSAEILGQTIQISLLRHDITPVSQNVAGPVGITVLVKDLLSLKNPLIPYLDFVAAISLNLALVNVLPFPGLDGGRLFFLLIEAITRKKVHAGFEKYVHTVGLALLLGLIFLITFSDIKKLL